MSYSRGFQNAIRRLGPPGQFLKEIESARRAVARVAPSLVCGLLLGLAAPASAAEPGAADPAFATLSAFAQQIGPTEIKPAIAVSPATAQADAVYDELRSFATALGTAKPQAAGEKAVRVAARAAAKVSTEPATFVGSAKCMNCHATQASLFAQTLMGKIGKVRKGTMECENCHGAGSVHVRLGGGRGVGGILSFGETDPRSVEERNAVCLACHRKGERTLWAGSVHETRGLACTNCHTVMKNVSRKHQLKTRVEVDTCFQCHKNKRAQIWRTSHMPVREGKMTCSDCHNPHGSFTEANLREATINDVCYKCHAEKRGPFLWEHPPVREDCLNCHDPHGSNNDFLLKISRPRLCQQCHAGGRHNSNPRNPFVTLYAQGRECQHCHSNHHGSNNPAGRAFMR